MFSQYRVCLLLLLGLFYNFILFLQAQKVAPDAAAAAAPVAVNDGAVVSGADPERAKQLMQAVAEQVSSDWSTIGLGPFNFDTFIFDFPTVCEMKMKLPNHDL